jgi:N-acetylglucosaminyl-diphospho-decaprenol L-rhamnosyltransferase
VIAGVARRPSRADSKPDSVPPDPLSRKQARGRGDQEERETVDISIVVVSYNRHDLVSRCIDSILSDQDRPDLELIVVDNASGDGTAATIAERYPDVGLIANDQNIGYGRACNQGLGLARGRYLLALNQDIVVAPGSLRALVAFADAHLEAGIVGARLEYADGRFQHSAFRFPDAKQAFFGFFDALVPIDSPCNGRYEPEMYERPFEAEHLLGACLLIRRDVAEQVGLFDPLFFMYFEETDLCARAIQAGWRNYYCPDARVMHVSAASTSAQSERMSVEFHRSQAIFFRRHRGLTGYAVLKGIVWAGIGYRLARSLRAYARGRISRDLLRERIGGYWSILWF